MNIGFWLQTYLKNNLDVTHVFLKNGKLETNLLLMELWNTSWLTNTVPHKESHLQNRAFKHVLKVTRLFILLLCTHFHELQRWESDECHNTATKFVVEEVKLVEDGHWNWSLLLLLLLLCHVSHHIVH